jgi:hypothetical protein
LLFEEETETIGTQLLAVLQYQTLVHALFGVPFLACLLGLERRDKERIRGTFRYYIPMLLNKLK